MNCVGTTLGVVQVGPCVLGVLISVGDHGGGVFDCGLLAGGRLEVRGLADTVDASARTLP